MGIFGETFRFFSRIPIFDRNLLLFQTSYKLYKFQENQNLFKTKKLVLKYDYKAQKGEPAANYRVVTVT